MSKNALVARCIKLVWLVACTPVLFSFSVLTAQAQIPSTTSSDFTSIGTSFGLSSTIDPRLILINLTRLVLSFTGLLAVIMVLYAGFLWMTSLGNEERIAKARATLTGGLIGLVIIISSYALVSFVIGALSTQLNG